MKKYKKIILIVVAVLIVIVAGCVVWLSQPKTLADLNVISRTTVQLYTSTSTTNNGEFEFSDLFVKNPEGIKEIQKILEETEISFDRIQYYADKIERKDGDIWVEIDDVNRLKYFQIVGQKEVRSGLPFGYKYERVYSISESEFAESLAALKPLFEKYGEPIK